MSITSALESIRHWIIILISNAYKTGAYKINEMKFTIDGYKYWLFKSENFIYKEKLQKGEIHV